MTRSLATSVGRVYVGRASEHQQSSSGNEGEAQSRFSGGVKMLHGAAGRLLGGSGRLFHEATSPSRSQKSARKPDLEAQISDIYDEDRIDKDNLEPEKFDGDFKSLLQVRCKLLNPALMLSAG